MTPEDRIVEAAREREISLAFYDGRVITTRLYMASHLDALNRGHGANNALQRVDWTVGDHIMRASDAMDELISEFRRRHWMGGLCARVSAARSGLVGETDSFQVLTGAMAGRVMLTIQGKVGGKFNETDMVTLITADGDITAKLSIQGIHATREAAIGLLWGATYAMPELVDGKVWPG